MTLYCFTDKDLKYTNRTIVDLKNRNFYVTEIKSFNGGDGINCSIIFNKVSNQSIPTYIRVNGGTFDGCQFFVGVAIQIRKNQYRLPLIRDVLSESESWKTAPALVYRGKSDRFDLRHKAFDLNLNVIKKEEFPLENKFAMVLFYNQAQDSSGTPIAQNLSVSTQVDNSIYATYNSIDDFPLKDFVSENYIEYDRKNPNFTGKINVTTSEGVYFRSYAYFEINTKTNKVYTNSGYKNEGANILLPRNYGYSLPFPPSPPPFAQVQERIPSQIIIDTNLSAIREVANNYFEPYSGHILPANFTDFQNKIISINNELYKVTIQTKSSDKEFDNAWQRRTYVANAFYSYFREASKFRYWDNNGNEKQGIAPSNFMLEIRDKDIPNMSFYYESKTIKIALEKLDLMSTITCTIPSDSPNLDSNPYKALIIDELTKETMNQWLIFGSRVLEQYPNFLQAVLVPANISGDFSLTTQNEPNNKIKQLVTQNHQYFVNINYIEEDDEIERECKMVRLRSPSNASVFDFKPLTNGGLESIRVSCTVKPFGTVVYCNPVFAGLYGADFDDKRGLIINEDFSLASVSDAWVNYKYQNTNFMNSFNREIESMELNNFYAKESDRLMLKNAKGESRALARDKAKAQFGVLDTILLGIPSLIGQATDKQTITDYMYNANLDATMNQALRNDAMSLKREMFDMSIGNIKAITPVLSKVDCFDIFFKWNIIVEVYESSDEEKIFVKEYYKHNGQPLNTIGTFNEFFGPYIEGRLIKDDNYTQAEFNEINDRLQGGIYTNV